MLDIYAGTTALNTLKHAGLDQSRFNILLGASGGPKWFVLYGLDRYLMNDFFKGRTTPLTLLGSSVGSFRAACFAQKQPAAAIERLAKHYIETTYGSKYVSPETVTESVRDIVDAMLGDNGVANILHNPVFKAHFIVARTRGLAASENRLLQGLGLLKSSRINKRSRSSLKEQYERFIFHPPDSTLSTDDPHNIPTRSVALTEANTREAILASGSLPIIMQGIRNIAGAAEGNYRDGGIVDYHSDLNVRGTSNTTYDSANETTGVNSQAATSDTTNDSSHDELILYPHFSAGLRAGWFDKKLPRLVKPEHYERVVLLCPSQAFIKNLPYGKIPDRSDFSKLDTESRKKFWWRAANDSEQLAEEFAQFIQNPEWTRVRPITDLTG